MGELVRVVVDAMGGDYAPAEPVKGAVDALNENDHIFVYLAGKEELIRQELSKYTYPKDRLEIVPADEVIETGEPPVKAIQSKKNSSLVAGLTMVRKGMADAIVSSGSTGAVLVGGQAIVRKVKGVERAPLAPLIPTEKGVALLIDCGATVDARPSHLVQFAVMGSIYMESVMGVKKPRVALVNIGAEEEKGNELVKETFPLLKENKNICLLYTSGYRYKTAVSGKEALMEAATHNPDILLLDLGLPDLDGVDIIRKIRTWSTMPIIVVSARSEDSDKIEALDAGADDYLTKPFSVEELLARLRVSIRRISYNQGLTEENPVFVNGELKIDYASGCAYLKEEELHLTPIEYKLLCLLAKNVGKVLTHTYLTREIWGSAFESDVASLRVFMATLRKKIETDTTHPQYIQTHVGVGYRMIRI